MCADNKASVADWLLAELATYVMQPPQPSGEALVTAILCLRDSIGCALAALAHPECVAHLGPLVPGAQMPGGAKVIGSGELLEPTKAAFDNGTLIRWLDFNDTWLAKEWGHPSDNLGGLLAVADYRCRTPQAFGLDAKVSVAELLRMSIQAHEIQGVLALENSFNEVGLDHVLLVKLATAGLVAKLTGGGIDEVISALSHAWIDGHSLRTYRHAPNTMRRKSWAAGDATSRGVRLALMATQTSEPAVLSALSARQWGFADVFCKGHLPTLTQKLGCYVMENILFKVMYPAEFHAQTAVECAVALHAKVRDRLAEISRIEVRTQKAATRIISKSGELRNYADRDHCIEYMVAVALLEGDLRAEHYSDEYAQRPEIDRLRNVTQVREDLSYSTDYLNPDRRAIANALRVTFSGGSSTDWIEVKYPMGHRRRREESLPLLYGKFIDAASPHLGDGRAAKLADLFEDPQLLESLDVATLVDMTC